MKLGKKDEDDNVPVTDSPTVGDEVQAVDQTDQSVHADQDLIDVINDQQAKITELTNLVQRTRADFENYRKHTEVDMARSRQVGEESVIKKLLPILDVLDSAMATVPDELSDNGWAKGIVGAHKNLSKMMGDLKLAKQPVQVGDIFDHNQHEAISFDDGDGEQEVVAEILRPGYLYDGQVLRPAMVRVSKH